MPKIAYIYHVIGTLGRDHIKYSIESIRNQQMKWDTLILYNGGDFDDKWILDTFPTEKFNNIEVFGYDKGLIKGAVVDWNEQIKKIGGHDHYFVHKADFYLADGVCETFKNLTKTIPIPYFLGFKKFDMREDANIKQIRRMANMRSYRANISEKNVLPYSPDEEPKWDGTMHAYHDGIRKVFEASDAELEQEVGACHCWANLAEKIGKESMITDNRMYAMHMFHQVTNLKGKEDYKLEKGRRY